MLLNVSLCHMETIFCFVFDTFVEMEVCRTLCSVSNLLSKSHMFNSNIHPPIVPYYVSLLVFVFVFACVSNFLSKSHMFTSNIHHSCISHVSITYSPQTFIHSLSLILNFTIEQYCPSDWPMHIAQYKYRNLNHIFDNRISFR